MDFARSLSRNGSTSTSTSSSTTNNSNSTPNTFFQGLNLNFQIPRIDLTSIGETLSQHNLIPTNLEHLFVPSQPSQTSASTPSSPSTSSHHRDMACEGCGARFSLIKRRKPCIDCGMDYCNSCIRNRETRRNQCRRCIVFACVPLDRNALMNLRVKDLRWYLAVKRIPNAQFCKEKSELVDLIFQSSQARNTYSQPQASNYSNSYPQSPNEPTNSNNASRESSFEFIDLTESFNTPTYTPPSSSTTNIPSHVNEPNFTSDNTSNPPEEEFKPFNIADLSNPDEIQALSIRQLKLLLTRNFVDYKGCCEKDELVEKAMRLWSDKQQSKNQNIDDISDSNICKICMESAIDCVLLECGHLVSCTACGKRLSQCPVCRQYVVRVVHIFKA